MQGKKRTAVASLFLFFVMAPLIALDVEEAPGWLILEKGKQLFDGKELGDAIYHFRRAREVLGPSPEVEYWIGRVFEAEGEYLLAAKQYETAIEKKRLLLVPDEEMSIRNRLAMVYFTLGDFAGYSEELEQIIRYDWGARDAEVEFGIEPATLARSLARQGYDKLLELYRIDDYGALSAYYNLGVYEYRTGLFEAGVEHLAFAFVISNTTLIKYLIRLDPEYRFTTLPGLMSDALRHRDLVDYMYAVDAFGQTYALAAALYETGEVQKRELAALLFQIVAEYDVENWWTVKARRQLISPFKDDFMIIFPE
ncbi:MAG: hypothetical protein JW852_05630 [Spirochaetales bacterium]|nr:hypothetical protein [Spirochaetales bacterium]